ncbi:cytochrome c oxidase accessory protein CcoG [Shewanella sp. AS16]|uniref:cytochrome c oxidase accessory protein CcoG n=1 Tax=Shewanella sp. AS16 TaxID=2907625 RepID=UPI001F34FF69|nr:cytochrome c oxidase accessory protein CcoG [Shewanella sp. AS16]MCE9685428.1 cytochrome c oxidase accessory protein CcoG [Shewanella sp. AS16]
MSNHNPSPSQVQHATPRAIQQTIPIVQLEPGGGKIHFREQKGDFQRLRTRLNSLLVCLFLFIPFLNYQGHQAILFDIVQQQFFFFGISLWPQDFTLLAWVFIIAAFGLFFVTVFWGRVWCGYLCPQTAWTFMFSWVENRIEGNSNNRKALDKAPWSLTKFRKRLAKHGLWGLMALLTGCGFIGYFIPARELYVDIFSFSAGFWVTSWVWFFALCTYLNAGWMREMMCLHCCPYARFQSVMFDANTKTVTYDAARGEARGPRKRKQETQLGDCVDCNLCVDVCPTGIDIRNGLQYECINCGACVDACNQTMEKFGYPLNLIGYASENQLKGQKHVIWRSPRFLGYGAAVLIMLVILGLDMRSRSEIQLNVIRDRQSLYRETLDEMIENSYRLKIRNKTQQDREYQLQVGGNPQYRLLADARLLIHAGEQLDYPITVQAPSAALDTSRQTIDFIVTDMDANGQAQTVSQSSSFFSH